jgi:cell division protein FtsL
VEAGVSAAARGVSRRPGWVRAFAWVLLLLGSLVLVTWRQTRGRNLDQGLSAIEKRHATAEAERVELVRRIEQLRSRARIVKVARERLGMHLPTDREIVFLPLPARHDSAAAERAEP